MLSLYKFVLMVFSILVINFDVLRDCIIYCLLWILSMRAEVLLMVYVIRDLFTFVSGRNFNLITCLV